MELFARIYGDGFQKPSMSVFPVSSLIETNAKFDTSVWNESALVFVIYTINNTNVILYQVPTGTMVPPLVRYMLSYTFLFWHLCRYARSVFLKVLESYGSTVFNRDELFANLFDEKLIVRDQNYTAFEIRDGFGERFA